MLRFLVAAVVLCAALGVRPAGAIPVFAHRYGLTCQACHTEVPRLTAFGEQFLAGGYRISGLRAKPAFPVAIRLEAAYSSAPTGGDTGTPKLPKAIVDEVEFLAGGALGPRTAYWTEVYAVDGGFPGRARDVWLEERLSGDGSRVPIGLRAGQFTLDLPLDPETFRETTDHYAIWDQTAGANPFAFFDPKIGLRAILGEAGRGTSASVSLLQGHDPQSGLPARGVDRAAYLQHVAGPVTLSTYRYEGTRPIAGADDRFWRQGYGVSLRRRGTELDAVYQSGWDARPEPDGDGLASSGGFLQVRRDLGTRAFAIARWDATQAQSFSRSVIAGFGYRPRRNMRLTIFDTIAPNGGTGRHTLSSSLLLAY